MDDLLVLVHDPVAQAGAPRDAPRELVVHDSQLGQFQEGCVIVGRRRVPALRNQVILDVNHPADHPFQQPLDHRPIDAALQKRRNRLCRERRDGVKVLGDQQQLPGDELAIDRHCASARILSRT